MLIAETPDRSVFYERGIIYQLIDNHSRAKKDFKEAIAIKNNYADAYFAMGKSRLELFKKNKSQLGGAIGVQAI